MKRATVGADAPERTRRRWWSVARGGATALAGQVVAFATGLVAIPLVVQHLGSERYGAWATIGSLLAWLSVGDLGLGNQLTSSLSNSLARDDSRTARELVATAFWSLSVFAVGLLLVGATIWCLLDWPAVLNVRAAGVMSEVAPAVILALVLYCFSLPVSLTERVLTSLQKGDVSNAWMIISSVASLLAIVVAIHSPGGLATLVVAAMGTALLVRAVSTGWLFCSYRPELFPAWPAVKRSTAVRLLVTGKDFCLVQIAALVLYNTDNIVIARVLGAEQVTPYAVAWRLFTIPNLALTAAFPYLFAAYAEAIALEDRRWILRALRSSTMLATAFAAITVAPLVLAGQGIIRAWVGAAAVPPWPVLAWMGAWSVILAPATSAVCLLNATGEIRWQVRVGLVAAVANVLLSVWWARVFGISGVIAATVVSYLVIVAAPLCAAILRRVRALVDLSTGTG